MSNTAMKTGLNKLIAGLGLSSAAAAVAAPVAGEGAEPTTITQSQIEAALETAYSDGYAAANVRVDTVMSSEPGKANPSAAVFMLCHSDAAAEVIVAKLPGMATAAPAPAATTPAPAVEPKVDPAAGAAASLASAPNPKTDDAAAAHDGDKGDKVDINASWDAAEKGASYSSFNRVTEGGITHRRGG